MRSIVANTAIVLGVLFAAAPARAADPPKDDWTTRYDQARTDMIEGRVREAEKEFQALAVDARTDGDRALALELARLSAAYAVRAEAAQTQARPAQGKESIRSTDELTLLYTSAFLYGVGTGSWFLLQTKPDSALTATLPFAALTAAPVIAIATIDGYKKLPRGVPHAVSAGLYLGLGEGIWLVGFQHGRSSRIEEQYSNTQVRWEPEVTASVLWTSATLGAVVGGVAGGYLPTTPGRVSFAASTTMWAGALTGLGAGALLPDNEYRREHAFLAGGIGYNAGLVGGLLSASAISPSVARVRLVDLLGIAGGLATAGFYLSVSGGPDTRVTEGLAVIGAGGGLALGWILTSGMPRDLPKSASALDVRPSLSPVAGGATIGLGGTL